MAELLNPPKKAISEEKLFKLRRFWIIVRLYPNAIITSATLIRKANLLARKATLSGSKIKLTIHIETTFER
jgi:hypothetical protein